MLDVVLLPLDQMILELARHCCFTDLVRFKTSVLKSEDELQAHSVSGSCLGLHMPHASIWFQKDDDRGTRPEALQAFSEETTLGSKMRG